MAYKLIEVNNRALEQEFLKLPVGLYKNEPNWIRPLNTDIESVFHSKQNKRFRNGEAIRWILKDELNNTVGRVAAFIDYQTSKTNEQPTGGLGFFECINSTEAAFILFNACKDWLKDRGMEAMDGPINFGDRDRWWGLLVDGDFEPNYCMGYHLTYYKMLFEQQVFKHANRTFCITPIG